jgi:hypothetical protein
VLSYLKGTQEDLAGMTDVGRLKSPLWQKSILPFLVALSSWAVSVRAAQSPQTFSDIGHVLDAIGQTYAVSTGFENLRGDLDKTPVALNLSGGDVASAFDSLVAQRTAYAWSLKDGSYDVYPKLNSDSVSRMKVANGALTNATVIEAVSAIHKLPEVQEWVSSHRVSIGVLIGESRMMTPGVPFKAHTESFALKETSILSILNQVYRSVGKTQWTIWHEGQRITMFVRL